MSVTCPHCPAHFPKSDAINARHKAVCPGWQVLLGDTKPRPCVCGHKATSNTQMKRHRSACPTWKARNRGEVQMVRLAETLQANHGEGVTNPRHVEKGEMKRKATLRERYGAENVFAKESSLFDAIQAASAPHRPVLKGQDNPFAWPAVQAKIKQANLSKFGVENPQQSAEVRARVQVTNLERYGVEEVLAAPEVRRRIEATNRERYGGNSPSCAPIVIEKARQTNLERWGVEWTAQHPDVRQKQLDTMIEHFGGHFFASEEGQTQIRAVLLKKYGVEYAPQIAGHWDRCVKTFLERYGVEHPRQDPAYWQTILDRIRLPGPNLLEQRFAALNPELLYTGNGVFWRWLPKLGHHKNPDFILPGPDTEHPKKGVTHVVEVFGDFWHSRMFTGRAPFAHEQELVEAYAEHGLKCLVVWESEFYSSPDEVRAKVLEFIS